MKRNVTALSGTQFDLVVIGGGVNGAATARDAALRGLKVALVDAGDFAGGTSSRSSKLIHGGLRYLAQGDFKLVREARIERRLLLKLAPHLAQPLPFLLPIYRGDPYSPLKMRAGLTIYDWLGNLGAQDRHRFYDPRQAAEMVPSLRTKDLRAGAVYHDSLTDDARLSFENVLDAVDHGAVAVNYAKVLHFEVERTSCQITAAEVEDNLSGQTHEIRGRFWVNAAGPWVDRVRALLPGYDGSKTIRMTKGTHVILPSISARYALFAAIVPGERIFLVMPWHGHSLLGTTDTEYLGDPEDVAPDRADVDYLIAALNRILREPVTAESVLGSYAGLRALVVEQGKKPSANTREYRFHRDPWAKNLITVCGGKLTTARALGEKLADLVIADLPGPHPLHAALSSRTQPLPGGDICGSFNDFVICGRDAARREFEIPSATAERIVRTYGSRWRKVLEPVRTQKSLATPLPGSSTLLETEVAFAVREEMAVKIEDFLLRRSGLSWMVCAYPETAPAVADIFARELRWSDGERSAALEEFDRVTKFRNQKIETRS
ncbi:MAG: glycerol-3-phosphate dehydrogenase [Acidobacteriota bacterium]|nr:glycerol-3-phosphate dehydrogenase [Acidobacteriota bacterium]